MPGLFHTLEYDINEKFITERLLDEHPAPHDSKPEEPHKTPLLAPVDESAPDAALCEVCCEHFAKDSFFALKCGHRFCFNCTVQHIEAKVELRELQILCLHQDCPQKFTLKNLQSLQVAADVVSRFKQVNQDYQVATSKKRKYCPSPNCDSVIQKPCCSDKVVCSQCTQATCFKCQKSWHEGRPCDRKFNFEKYAAAHRNKFWPCPTCKAPVEKISGCNKMQCNQCKKNFCWICKEKISDTSPYSHFRDNDYGDIFD